MALKPIEHLRLPKLFFFLIALFSLSNTLYAQREFRVLRSMESGAQQTLPDDYKVPGEFVIGRLMYPSSGGRGGNWELGGTNWAVDYPLGDRTYLSLLRRLTTINVRSVEQPVNLDDGDDVFNWPFLFVGMPGSWNLTDSQIAKLREYLLRGGFLLADSFFGSEEWAGFERSLRRIFPNRAIVDLPDDHSVFNILYQLNDRKQIGNMRSLIGRGVPYRADGAIPYWKAVLDDNGRVMVAISFNNDMGDSWQHADDPNYPQQDADLGIRFGVNYAVYSMTH